MQQPIKVSIFCSCYNHEQYIERALKGFVSQQTDFAFEVLVHDDASTDNSPGIIRRYQEKYPHIIKAILQTENQYSKKVPITRTILLPQARGQYLAWCEGDDCWLDPLKLQKQITFLDQHPEYSMCTHSVLFHNVLTGEKMPRPKITEERDYTADEVIRSGALFQLSSVVVRKEVYSDMPDCLLKMRGVGDIQIYINAALRGKCHALPDVMSQYNHGVPGSWTNRVAKNAEKCLEHEKRQLEMYRALNEYTQHQYYDSFSHCIHRAEFNILTLTGQKKASKQMPYKPFYKQLKRTERYLWMKKYLSFAFRIKQALSK